MAELQAALHKAHDTAVGPDNIHYQMLKHLPESALDTLLNIFNDIWITGNFPSSWSAATIIPIPKPGKNATSSDNYRPIALTSCVCKTFERMINERLVWYLENKKLLTEFQSGFRKQRSTTDQLLGLESFVREAFVRRSMLCLYFFILRKHTTRHGSTESSGTCIRRVSKVACQLLSQTFWQIETSESVLARTSPTPSNRRWVFRRAASYLLHSFY